MKLGKSIAYTAIALAFGASAAFAGTGATDAHERDLSVRTGGAHVEARVGTPGLEVDPRFDPHGREAKALDADKQTGPERADEVAGEHGQHGRDNAAEKQGG